MWRTGSTSVSPNVAIRLVRAVGERKELRVPISLISKTRLKIIETTAVVDSRAARTFISEEFVKQHHIRTHALTKPFRVTTADGSYSRSGAIRHYCVLNVKIDGRTMIGKFNVTRLARRDQILLGIPWLRAMNPLIYWAAETLILSPTLKSDQVEEEIDKARKKNDLPLLFKKRIWKNSKLKKEEPSVVAKEP